MRIRDTVLGVVVLGLVLAGMFWARTPSPTAGSPTSATAGDADPDRSIPDITAADGVVHLGDVRIVLSVAPRPPVAFEQVRVRVRVESNGEPASLEGGRVSFEMTMPMGDHRYSIVPGDDGWQEAEVVLPMCQSGNPRWFASVEGRVAGQAVAARFRLDLAKPGSAPTAAHPAPY